MIRHYFPSNRADRWRWSSIKSRLCSGLPINFIVFQRNHVNIVVVKRWTLQNFRNLQPIDVFTAGLHSRVLLIIISNESSITYQISRKVFQYQVTLRIFMRWPREKCRQTEYNARQPQASRLFSLSITLTMSGRKCLICPIMQSLVVPRIMQNSHKCGYYHFNRSLFLWNKQVTRLFS